MVDRAVWPAKPDRCMLPVSDATDTQEVWFALDFARRQVFDSHAKAVEMKTRIINQYGGDEVIAIVTDDPKWSDQQTRDRYLPYWAWEAKYGLKA